MRVVIDGTPLLGRRTGVGRYTERLLAGLVDLTATDHSVRDARGRRVGNTIGGGSWDDGGGQAGGWDGGQAGRWQGVAGGERASDAIRTEQVPPVEPVPPVPPVEPVELAVTAFTWRGLDELAGALPSAVRVAAHRAPARLLQQAWMRGKLPPVEWLCGAADVVHATNFVLPPTRAAAGVLTIHDLSYLLTPDTVTSASARYVDLVPRGLRRASVVLTPSRAVANEVESAYRLDPERVVVTPLGVDPSWFDVAAPTPAWLAARGLPERYLVFVGTAEPRKNLPVLLEALRVLRATRSDTPPLLLVGPPGWGPALDVAGLPADAVAVAGYLDDPDLRSVVAGAVASCFPSRYEGFGLPPLEALAAGTPVVASDIPAVREVVGAVAGTTVRLAPPSDADAFADALAGVLDGKVDPARGRAHARTFTWRRTAELTLAAYHQAGG